MEYGDREADEIQERIRCLRISRWRTGGLGTILGFTMGSGRLSEEAPGVCVIRELMNPREHG